MLLQAIDADGGWLFKHTGDGVCAAFASPRSAVDAAVAAQRELELPVRMGIATGEAEPRDGDYFGAVLNRAARVMAAGHGGQILRGRVDGRSAWRSRPRQSGAAATARCTDACRGVSSTSARTTHGVSAAAGARYDAREPAACDHQLDRPWSSWSPRLKRR